MSDAHTATPIAVDIQIIIETIKEEMPKTRETSIVITKLDEAILWLVKATQEIQKTEQKEQEND